MVEHSKYTQYDIHNRADIKLPSLRKHGLLYSFIENTLEQVAEVLESGEHKYGTRSWRKHTSVHSNCAAIVRHAIQAIEDDYKEKRSMDEDTALHPLIHVITRALFALYLYQGKELINENNNI